MARRIPQRADEDSAKVQADPVVNRWCQQAPSQLGMAMLSSHAVGRKALSRWSWRYC